eukprot:237740-Prorocentrum_minimum.AAC.1
MPQVFFTLSSRFRGYTRRLDLIDKSPPPPPFPVDIQDLRAELGLPELEAEEAAPLSRSVVAWDTEVAGLQKLLADRNCDRAEAVQKCKDHWDELGTPESDREFFLSHHASMRADIILQVSAMRAGTEERV